MRIRRIIGAAFLLVGTVGAVLVNAGMGDVISSFKMPISGLNTGLAWDGQYLWACYDSLTLTFRITTVGSLVSSFRISAASYGYFYGAAYDGRYLWICESPYGRERTHFSRFTTTGSRVGWFEKRYESTAGMTWEPGYLWHQKFKYTTSGSLVASFSQPFGLNDLAWDGHYLWAGGNGLYMTKFTTTGSVVTSFPVPGGGSATGAAFDGNYLWLVDGGHGWAYQVDIEVVGVDAASMGKIKAVYL